MKCEHCGANIDKASNFCPVCGSKLSKNEPDKKINQEDLTQKRVFQIFLILNLIKQLMILRKKLRPTSQSLKKRIML